MDDSTCTAGAAGGQHGAGLEPGARGHGDTGPWGHGAAAAVPLKRSA